MVSESTAVTMKNSDGSVGGIVFLSIRRMIPVLGSRIAERFIGTSYTWGIGYGYNVSSVRFSVTQPSSVGTV